MCPIFRNIMSFFVLYSISLYSLEYPETPLSEHSDNYHGVDVADPYRWLEDGEDPLVQEWDTKQKKLYQEHQESNPHKHHLITLFKEFFAEGKTNTIPLGTEGRLLTSYQDSDQHSQIFYIQEEKEGVFKTLLDVNVWEGEHTIRDFTPSPDGNRIAFEVMQGGNEKPQLVVVDTYTREILSDTYTGQTHSSVTWLQDSSGFYYTTYPDQGDEYFHQAVYFHRVGTSKEQDIKIHEAGVCKDWHYALQNKENTLYIYRLRSDQNYDFIVEGFSKSLADPEDPVVKIYDGSHFTTKHCEIGGEDYLLTDEGSHNFHLVKIVEDKTVEIIPEGSDILLSVHGINGKLAAVYRSHGHHLVKIFDIEGIFLKEIPLPGPGTLFIESEWESEEADIIFSSLTEPKTLYKYHEPSHTLTVETQDKYCGYNPDEYVTQQIFVTSKDGTQIPVHIAHRKNFTKGFLFLTGYGGFRSAQSVAFDPTYIPWLESNAAVAVIHLRGGDEYGESWHKGGSLANKQNVFNDFIAAAEALTKDYSSPENLAIWGGSNGGLLTGAALVQRPDLFGAAVSAVPLLDMLRYQHFRRGYLWIGEYGSAENQDQFPYLYDYSPYHNVRKDCPYPSVLIEIGLKDYRCDPLHGRKMAAKLQAANPKGKPHLLNINFNGGHTFHSTLSRIIRKSEHFGFLMQEIGMEPPSLQKATKSVEQRKISFFSNLLEKQKSQNYEKELKNASKLYEMNKQLEKKNQQKHDIQPVCL